MTLFARALRREAEGSIGRRPRCSDCCWAARASSEAAALHRFASGGELDLKSASVSYSCGGKTPSWRAICWPPVFSLIRKRRNLSNKPWEDASLHFFPLAFLNVLFFFFIPSHPLLKLCDLNFESSICLLFWLCGENNRKVWVYLTGRLTDTTQCCRSLARSWSPISPFRSISLWT